MASRVSVVFDADTRAFRTEVDAASGSVSKQAETVASAKNQILSSFKLQTQAAKEAGASQNEIDAIRKRSAEMLSRVTEENATRTINALNRVQERQRAVAQEMEALGKRSSIPHGFTDQSAASAVVRFGEGTTSIRATERFLTMIPGATAAAQGLATVIGGAGLLGMIVELGDRGWETFTKLRDATKEATAAAEEQHTKSRVRIDDLEIENQRIQDQIDKLSGHPNNGLATALLEAKKNADQLLVSLQADRKEMEALFGQQQRGFLANAMHSLFNTGPDGTEQQRKELLAGQDDLEHTIGSSRASYDAALSAAKDDNARKAATAAFNASTHKAIQDRIDTLKREYNRLAKEETDSQQAAIDSANAGTGYASRVTDNSLKRQNVASNIGLLQDRLRVESLDESIYSGQQTLGQLKQDKAAGGGHSGPSAAELARQKAEAQRQQWSDQLTQMELNNPTYKSEDLYNLRYQQQTTALPQNKIEAEKQTAAALREWVIKSAAEVKQARDQAERDQQQQWDAQYQDLQEAGKRTAQANADYWDLAMLEADKGSANYLEAQRRYTQAMRDVEAERNRSEQAGRKATAEQANTLAREQEATVALEAQTGQLSRYDAAVQLANIHTQQYAAQQRLLRQTLEDSRADDAERGLNAPSAQTIDAQTAVDKAAADRRIQIQEDAAHAAAETWQGALKQANATWINDSENSAAQVKQLYAQALDGLNDQLSNLMTGGKSDFSGYFRSLGKSLSTVALQKGESAVMGALGLGKPDGSSSNPLYVRMADAAQSAGGGVLGGIAKLFGKKSDDDDDSVSDVGEGIGSAMGSIAQSFAGGFALGGDAPKGSSFTAGEFGPERIDLAPGTAAHISTARETNQGGSVFYNVSVGAGVTPSEMEAKMHSVLSQYHGTAVKASAAYMTEQQRRKAPSAR